MPLDRRRFLQLTTLGLLATATDSACAPSNDGAAAASAEPRLVDMLGADRVRQLGAHYRAATPSESTAEALRAAHARRPGVRLPFVPDKSTDKQIRDDFAAGRTVLVDGWVLSVTEARQCALYSLKSA
jgi:hypothetical protein